jgi:hypothetical protein
MANGRGEESRRLEMSALARNKAVWRTNAFWFVGMPTILVTVVFFLAMIASALGQ